MTHVSRKRARFDSLVRRRAHASAHACIHPRARVCSHARGGGGEGREGTTGSVVGGALNEIKPATFLDLGPTWQSQSRAIRRETSTAFVAFCARSPPQTASSPPFPPPPPPRNFRHAVRILTLNLRSFRSGYVVLDLAESRGSEADEEGRGGRELITARFTKRFNLIV